MPEVVAMIRYHHVKWDPNEWESEVYATYPLAKSVYDRMVTHDYYDQVLLYECVQLEAKR